VNKADSPPAAAEIVVFMAARDATLPLLALVIVNELPGLKPYHPNHNEKVPRNCSVTEWGGKFCGSGYLLKHQIRAIMISVLQIADSCNELNSELTSGEPSSS
jgi:hypothetical protein